MEIIGPQRDQPLADLYHSLSLDVNNIPRHVAIIMDGNGRWAKQRNLPRIKGHQAGIESLKSAVRHAADLGIQYLSVYAFSTENWKRSQDEVSYLMGLFRRLLIHDLDRLHANGVRMVFCGDLSRLDEDLQRLCRASEEKTAGNTVVQLNVMINYGSRLELKTAIQAMLKEGLDADELTEETISSYLTTSGIPDPEILIRTSAEYRLSNYMLWQLAYSELFFIDTFWPDFSRDDLISVLRSYQDRERRFGGRINA